MSSVHHFGAAGDGKRDDTEAIQHAISDGEGLVEFPRGDYLITKTIDVNLAEVGRIAITGSGGTAKILMAGAGPAFRIVGTHAGTADPATMKPVVWRSERMARIAEIEIEGAHGVADGIELVGTVQPIIKGVGLHGLRHGIRLTERNRNVLIEGCQIYHNTGVGVFFDAVNLHQINVIGNHISYNRLGGIRIERSEIRNLQITGNDIEYNNDRSHKIENAPTAEIYIDCTAQNATVNEVTIASNTIQATASEGGSNLRIIEDDKSAGRPPGLYAITGNVIGSQTNNVHLSGCYGITLTGNNIYSAARHNLLLDGGCRQIIVASNQFRRHTPDMGTGIRIADSSDCLVSGCHVLDEADGGQASGLPLLEVDRCERLNINGCQLQGAGTPCLRVNRSSAVLLSASSVSAGDGGAIVWTGEGGGNLITGCRIAPGADAVKIARDSNVAQENNLLGT